MSKIEISPQLSFPLSFVSERIAFLARTGAGKSGGMRVLNEEMLEAGQFTITLDPKGDAWGVRSDYSVLIMGGDHADIPLKADAGAFVADFLVKERISTVLDVSEFSEAEMVRFVGDFGERFYRTNRESVHLFIDEADEFAPQSGYNAAGLKCLGAIQRVQRRGRGRGIGVTVATQRSAVINKSVLTQAGTLIAMQTTAPQDLEAVDAWLKYAATKEARHEIMASLPTLKPREAYVYSPQFLGTEPYKIVFRAFNSFDSMKTPKPGEARAKPKRLADIDLSAVQRDMAVMVDEVKQNDPAHLKRQIAELKKQKAPVVTAPASKVEITRAVVERDREWRERYGDLQGAYKKLEEKLRRIGLIVHTDAGIGELKEPEPISLKSVGDAPKLVIPKKIGFADNRVLNEVNQLSSGERRVLAALIQFPEGVDRSKLTILTAYKRSTRDRLIQYLKQKGLADESGGTIVATEAAQGVLPDAEPLPTGEALLKYWLARLPAGQKRLLEVLVERYPNSVSRDEASEVSGLARSTRDRYFQYLEAAKIVESTSDGMRATEAFFQ